MDRQSLVVSGSDDELLTGFGDFLFSEGDNMVLENLELNLGEILKDDTNFKQQSGKMKRPRANSVTSGCVNTSTSSKKLKNKKSGTLSRKCLRSRQRRQELNQAFSSLRNCLSLKAKSDQTSVIAKAEMTIINLRKELQKLKHEVVLLKKENESPDLSPSPLIREANRYIQQQGYGKKLKFTANTKQDEQVQIRPACVKTKSLLTATKDSAPQKGKNTKKDKPALPFPPFPMFGMFGIPSVLTPSMPVQVQTRGRDNDNEHEKTLQEMKKLMSKMHRLYESAATQKQQKHINSADNEEEEITHSHCA
mmetsp:Transcript_7084/g.8964  ORF Transcript_7084/g.8964 Transcript_7084/m.8964 type:complete len:307 (-) Transcript_7084:1345-2265(-)|eukprot:CAMPEP_0204823746 /NCGR_PEP_ID=MMETSP1346-20131115/1829_1 /ASSEMBLY_ACC=CAM_ASM_000771 /TAXON_ID=215587 /ORGANISM="Aplanochytrium stocchinoi, Strain GSBS06" /LENGTH=306 /DNA_ID=CAMNT_0051950527 /DNA_START=230 /DNA_END=1150 /DNA_ORIENTATION=+